MIAWNHRSNEIIEVKPDDGARHSLHAPTVGGGVLENLKLTTIVVSTAKKKLCVVLTTEIMPAPCSFKVSMMINEQT